MRAQTVVLLSAVLFAGCPNQPGVVLPDAGGFAGGDGTTGGGNGAGGGSGDGGATLCGHCEGTACTDDDGPCGPAGHCDQGTCQPNQPAGTSCDEDTDCADMHCSNHVCCGSGECCLVATDCAGAANPPRSCDLQSTCQGHRSDAVCGTDFRCGQRDVDDDSACAPTLEASTCGAYTSVFCDGGVSQTAPTCPTTCTGDPGCVPTAHCSAAQTCVADLADGLACPRDAACQSGHCQNGFCCSGGDCCAQASDCPGFGSQTAVCDTPATCQGTRGDSMCSSDHRCTTNGMVQDDSACAATTLASDCGPYPAVYCTGAVSQTPPACATGCQTNTDCDADAFCEATSHTCQPDRSDGATCGDAMSCQSGHCQNGFCCGAGDCCATGADCPSSYRTPPTCDNPSQCRGSQSVATCTASQCGTQPMVRDDSACGPTTLSSTCGFYPSAFCTGGAVQMPAACAASCTADTECDADGHCAGSQCVADLTDGSACARDAQCEAGHCENGFCCSSGECCSQSADCGALAAPAVCDSAPTCQGHRVDGACLPTHQCSALTVDDDSACATLEANTCGPYPSAVCSAAQSQTTPTCSTTCSGDAECDASAHCAAMACVPDTGVGGFCSAPNECSSGLSCVDNVCCTSSCTGSCRACDLPGSLGTCTNVPNGQDVDAECGAVSCVGYFHSWSGDTCRRKADVPANQATCDGAGACRTQAQECSAQTTVGPVTTTCNANCQNPTASTCTGTTAGACTNVNPGTQTCGVGACINTVNQCSNGAPLTCNPLPPSAETCNDVDDNCNGTIDDGAFSDAFEPNPDCGSARTLNTAGSDQTQSYNTMTLYASGDSDTYALPLLETDGSCGCGALSVDEDYEVRVTLTVPVGAGTYELCLNTGTCGWPSGFCFNVSAGNSLTVNQFLDGTCAPGQTDQYTSFVRIRGVGGAGFECRPYLLSYTFDAGLCR